MTTPTAPRLWGVPGYVLWLVSDTSKGLATALASFAIPLIALAVTGDPAQAGVIAAIGVLVRLVVTLGGGVLADRMPRLSLMLIGALIATAIAAGFTLLALADALTFATLVAVEALLMVRAGLFEPAGEAALKQIVPAGAMGRAQAANQARDAALQLAGGPLGGLLLAAGGWLVGAAMTVCYAVAALTAGILRRGAPSAPATPVAPSDAPPAPRSAAHELRAGFSWLLARPDLRGVLLIVTIINLGLGAATTTIVYALQQSGHGELTIGTVMAGIGAFLLTGAAAAPALVTRVRAGVLLTVGLCAATAGIAATAAVRDPWAIMAILGVSILPLPAVNAAMSGYLMVATPSEMLGRVSAVGTVLGTGAMPLAPLVAGFGLALAGREGTILAATAICAVAAALGVADRTLHSLPAESGWAAHAERAALPVAR